MVDYAENAYLLFDNIKIVRNSRINSAGLKIPIASQRSDTINTTADVHCDDTESAVIPSSSAEMIAKNKTDAFLSFSHKAEKSQYPVTYSGYTNELMSRFGYNQANPFGVPVGSVYLGGGLGSSWPETVKHYFFVYIENFDFDSTDIIYDAKIYVDIVHNYMGSACSCYVYGNAIDNASPPTTAADMLALEKTSAVAAFYNEADNPQATRGDLEDVIMEIIQRPNWVRGNNILFLFWPGSDTGLRKVAPYSSYPLWVSETIQTTGYNTIIQEVAARDDWFRDNSCGIMFWGTNNGSYLKIPRGVAAVGALGTDGYETLLEIDATAWLTYLRFDSINLEKGMQIASAYVDFAEISDFFSAAASCRIYAEDTVTATNLTESTGLTTAVYPAASGDDGGINYIYDPTLTTQFLDSDNYAEFGVKNTGGTDYEHKKAWIRFQNVEIPLRAAIKSARIKFVSNDNYTGAFDTDIKILDSYDAFPPPSSAESYESKAKSAPISWSITEDWVAGESYYSPELKTILQPVINNDGGARYGFDYAPWASGNSVMFFIEVAVPDIYQTEYRGFYCFDNGEHYPQLEIEYETILNISKTTTYVAYEESATSGASTTPDIKSVIQEIINKPEWVYGNNINLIFWGINEAAYKADVSAVSASLRITA